MKITFLNFKKYCHNIVFTVLEASSQTYKDGIYCLYTDMKLSLPADDEMWHGNQEGPKRHQNTSDCYDLGSVEFGTKIAHKGNHQQIPYQVEMIRRKMATGQRHQI